MLLQIKQEEQQQQAARCRSPYLLPLKLRKYPCCHVQTVVSGADGAQAPTVTTAVVYETMKRETSRTYIHILEPGTPGTKYRYQVCMAYNNQVMRSSCVHDVVVVWQSFPPARCYKGVLWVRKSIQVIDQYLPPDTYCCSPMGAYTSTHTFTFD